MSQTEFIMLLIVGIIGILIVLEINSRKKLRADIRYKWGKLPYQVRFDKEESLKEAWQTEKSFARGTVKSMT